MLRNEIDTNFTPGKHRMTNNPHWTQKNYVNNRKTLLQDMQAALGLIISFIKPHLYLHCK